MSNQLLLHGQLHIALSQSANAERLGILRYSRQYASYRLKTFYHRAIVKHKVTHAENVGSEVSQKSLGEV